MPPITYPNQRVNGDPEETRTRYFQRERLAS